MMYMMAWWLSCLHCLHCRLTARRSWVRFPHGALLALGGRSFPDLQCSGGLSPWAFCVEFACSPRVHKEFPPLRTPTEKHAKRTEHITPKMDSSLHLVPGCLQAAHCSWGVLEEGQSRMGEKQRKNSPRTQACACAWVCVCV